ncbi:MAG: hypothetical protein U1A27_03945 [Phycisphaerae bacterium]
MDSLRLPLSADRGQPDGAAAAATVVVIGTVVSLALGFVSAGCHQFDDVTRYLVARWAWSDPRHLLGDWAHPGFMILYVLPARFGWHAARALSALLTGATGWLAFSIARELRIGSAWLAALATWVQPLVFILSLTTLSETVAAFYLAAAVLLALRGRWTASAAVLSLLLTARSESIILVPIWIGWALSQRARVWRLWPIIWAPLVVIVAQTLSGMPRSFATYLNPRPISHPEVSGALTLFSRLLESHGPAVAMLGLAGLAPLARSRRAWPLAAILALFIVSQGVVRFFGLYIAGRIYPRQLVPMSPVIAVAATALWADLRERGRARRAALGALGVATLLLWVAMERQLHLPEPPIYVLPVHIGKWLVRVSAGAVLLSVAALLGAPRRAGIGSGELRRRRRPARSAGRFTRCVCSPVDQVIDAGNWLDAHGYRDRPAGHVARLSGFFSRPRRTASMPQPVRPDRRRPER